MSDLIEKAKAYVKDVKAVDISRTDLGALGFVDAEKIKNKSCDYMLEVLQMIPPGEEDDILALDAVNQINTHAKQLDEFNQKSNQLITSALHTPEFPQHKQALINQYQKNYMGIRRALASIELRYRTIPEVRDDRSKEVEALKEDLENLQARLRASVAQSDETIKKAQDAISTFSESYKNKGLEQSSEQFADLLDHHRKTEKTCLILVIVFAVLLAASVGHILTRQSYTSVTPRSGSFRAGSKSEHVTAFSAACACA